MSILETALTAFHAVDVPEAVFDEVYPPSSALIRYAANCDLIPRVTGASEISAFNFALGAVMSEAQHRTLLLEYFTHLDLKFLHGGNPSAMAGVLFERLLLVNAEAPIALWHSRARSRDSGFFMEVGLYPDGSRYVGLTVAIDGFDELLHEVMRLHRDEYHHATLKAPISSATIN